MDNNYYHTAQRQLADTIDELTKGKNMLETGIPGVILHRWNYPTEPVSYMHDPSICVIAQGRKQVVLGSETYIYDDNHFLVSSLDLPIIANILEASEDKPYLGITCHLDKQAIAHLLVDTDLPSKPCKEPCASMAVGEVTQPMLNIFLNLVNLVKEPEQIKILAPLYHKELLIRLLGSEQGPRLRDIARNGSRENQVARAIDWLKENYSEQLRIESLASHVMMSASSLHHNFREMTNMSPLQYQKWIRLHEARRLMLTERMDVSNAAFEVGYESPSQFSREYKRMFGNPPLRDIKLMNMQ
ncbi:AraC family transcriptional regulator [Limisalsivibrio acetivorans]|uniref:AraC family transcriptional regulator n=1 Tax=Limisalsivibrio acetivorans TaxID=1304888 RepID=UPI0003B3734B|nr:AraC family transcriptional regulator [Limisalsivibrio acetivorans]